MTAAEVLAKHRYAKAACDGCCKAYGYPDRHAAHQIDALKEAGYAVVDLPKMLGVNGTDNKVWCNSPYIEQEFNGDVVISDRIGFDVDELRTIAAALLSAAAAAEVS